VLQVRSIHRSNRTAEASQSRAHENPTINKAPRGPFQLSPSLFS
jgi:hypothetical protein